MPNTFPNLQIPAIDAKFFQGIIDSVKSITITGSQVVSTFTNTQALIDAAYNFLSYGGIEGSSSVTYHDQPAPGGKLTIGVGFNLEPPIAKNILIAAKISPDEVYVKDSGIPPKYNDGFEDGWPKNDPNIVDKLRIVFRILLINDPQVAGWTSKAEVLQGILVDNGLGNRVFTGYEIIALQSLIYQRTDLLGSGLIAAIKAYKSGQFTNPLRVVTQIVECTNAKLEVGVSNRRLCEAALFVGNTDMIVLPYRQQQKILAKHTLSQAPTNEPLSIKGYHTGFVGDEQAVTILGCYDEAFDQIILGSRYDDYLKGLLGSPVVLGGAGDDVLIAPPAVSDMNDGNATFPYYAGNDGTNTYQAALMPGQIKIYDVNRQGQVFHDGNEVSGMSIGGILKTLARDFTLVVQAVEDDVQMALDWAMPGHSITVGNVDVVKGTVGILPRENPI